MNLLMDDIRIFKELPVKNCGEVSVHILLCTCCYCVAYRLVTIYTRTVHLVPDRSR
mgnify:CR=1 FL=1